MMRTMAHRFTRSGQWVALVIPLSLPAGFQSGTVEENRKADEQGFAANVEFFGGRKSLQKRSPFTVGIVEASGNLVPVATFDGAAWSSPWPAGLVSKENIQNLPRVMQMRPRLPVMPRAVPEEIIPSWPNLPEHWNHRGGSLKKWILWYEDPESSPERREGRWMWWKWIDRLSPVRMAITTQGLVMSGRRKPVCDKYPALSTDAEDCSPP